MIDRARATGTDIDVIFCMEHIELIELAAFSQIVTCFASDKEEPAKEDK